MSKTRIIDQTDVICGLKAAVTALECHHNVQILKGQKEKIKHEDITPSSVHVVIPIRVDTHVAKKKSKSKLKCETCVSSKRSCDKIRRRREEKSKVDQCKVRDISRLIFPEMRGGILYSRCCCLHRDGLQDHCPLSQCQGQPECLTKPWAICPPGRFVRSRYPELYPTYKADCVT